MAEDVISAGEIEAGFNEAKEASEAPPSTSTANSAPPVEVRAPAATTTTNNAPAGSVDWKSQPLPPEASAAWGGAKTMAEALQRYSASSREAKRLAAEMQQRAAQPTPAPKPAAPAPTDFYGYPNVDEYNAAMAKNPREAVGKLIASAIQSNPDIIRSMVEPILGERLAPITQREFAATDNSHAQAAFTAHPEFAPGTPGYDAGQAWVEQNEPVAKALWTAYQADPSFNFHEIVGKLANYEILKSQQGAQRAAQVQAGKRAGAARPGSNASARPRTDDPEANMASIIQDEQARGNAIPAEWGAQLARTLRDIR